jgi:hypothetical protein
MFTFGRFKKYNKFITRFEKRNDPKVVNPFVDALNVPNHSFQNLTFILCENDVVEFELLSHLKDMMFHPYHIHMLSVSLEGYAYDAPLTSTGIYGTMVYHERYNIALNIIQPNFWKAMIKAVVIVENLTKHYTEAEQFDIFDTTYHHLVIPNGG